MALFLLGGVNLCSLLLLVLEVAFLGLSTLLSTMSDLAVEFKLVTALLPAVLLVRAVMLELSPFALPLELPYHFFLSTWPRAEGGGANDESELLSGVSFTKERLGLLLILELTLTNPRNLATSAPLLRGGVFSNCDDRLTRRRGEGEELPSSSQNNPATLLGDPALVLTSSSSSIGVVGGE
jgi:hypothetical protein